MGSIYRHRNVWQASVTVAGANHKKNFRTRKEAETWAAQLHGELQQAHAPLLGGPAKATVGRTLYEYAHLYTIHNAARSRKSTSSTATSWQPACRPCSCRPPNRAVST
jgi:hypothetical protein